MMETEVGTVVVEPEKSPYGKVIGVVTNHDQLHEVTQALATLGVQEIEVLEGAAGINVLNEEQGDPSQYFLGDMEVDVIQRYLEAVKGGQIVFAAVVDAESANHAAATASECGASDVVHFGNWVITNY
jgi:precorrin-6B methylase 2